MGRKNKSNIIGTLASVSGIVILSKLLGFVKQIVTANAFGATLQTDIIFIAEGLILNFDFLLVQALSTAFIPIYISAKTNSGDDNKRFVSNVIKAFLIITCGIVSVLIAFANVFSKILAPSYDAALSAQLATYIRVFAPTIIILVEMALFNSLLKANERFIPGELVSFNQSAIIIVLVIAIGGTLGPDTLVAGFYAYCIFNLLFLMVYAYRYWQIFRGNPFSDKRVRKLLKMMGPLLVGYSLVFVNQQVDKIIVSGLGEGAVTAMNYAAVLSNFINTFVGSICAVLFTYVSQSIAEKQNNRAANLTVSSTIHLITVLLPISTIAIANTADIVTIVFGRGKFDEMAITNCSMALAGYSFTFVPFAIRELFSRFQYAHEDSKTPMINSTISIVINIVLSILLSLKWGVLGVTLATSISVMICALLNVWTSAKMERDINFSAYVTFIPRWLFGVIACLFVTYYGKSLLADSHILYRFTIIAIASFIIYGVINYPEIKLFFEKKAEYNK